MDDMHGFGPEPGIEMFKADLAVHLRFRDSGVHHDGSEYDHLKRFRQEFNGVTTIESNLKYLDAVLELLGLEGAEEVPKRSCAQGTAQCCPGTLVRSFHQMFLCLQSTHLSLPPLEPTRRAEFK